MEKKSKIISITGLPVDTKKSTIEELVKKLKKLGYPNENIHCISIESIFRNYLDTIIKFIQSINDDNVKKISEQEIMKKIFSNNLYRRIIEQSILNIKYNHIDTTNIDIESVNTTPDLTQIRNLLYNIINTEIQELCTKMSDEEYSDTVCIIDFDYEFFDMPNCFSIRLTTNDSKVMGERKPLNDSYDLTIETTYSKISDIADTILICEECYINGQDYTKNWISPKVLLPTQTERDTCARGMFFTMDEMIEIIRTEGYLPEKAIEIGISNNEKYILDGHHRNYASAILGKTLVPYIIVEGDVNCGTFNISKTNRINSVQTKMLRSHEWFFGDNFSYDEVYYGIYDKLKQKEGIEI